MRMALVISSLGPGGAERVLTLLANRWAALGHTVSLITLAGCDESPFYDLHADIKLMPLGLLSQSQTLFAALSANIKRVKVLRKTIAKTAPGAVISFQDTTNVLTLMACSGMDVPVIVSDRVDPDLHDIGRIWRYLKKRRYPRATHIVVQTKATLKKLPCEQLSKGRVIPNPVTMPTGGAPAPRLARPVVVAVGRLTPQKGFDTLLHAFKAVADLHPEWTLKIFGEGEQRAQLEQLAAKLNITDRVDMPGRTRHLASHLSNADIFVLSSRYEGFPNVLLEAMACGLACVATDCPSGPGEILTHGKNGLLVPPENPNALAQGISSLMADPNLRSKLGTQAKCVLDQFAMDKIGAMWDELIGISS